MSDRRERRRAFLVPASVMVLLCLVPCFTIGPGAIAVHAFQVRHFSDHEAIRAACLELLQRPAGISRRNGERVPHDDLPDALRKLSSRCDVYVFSDRVMVDVGRMMDNYGFVATVDGATGGSVDSGTLVIPGLYWWDAG